MFGAKAHNQVGAERFRIQPRPSRGFFYESLWNDDHENENPTVNAFLPRDLVTVQYHNGGLGHRRLPRWRLSPLYRNRNQRQHLSLQRYWGHADAWHGRPAAEGGGDFVFEGDNVPFYCDWSVDCTLAWSGKIKKCQDNNGNWRVGFQINGASMSNGTFCGLHRFSGFPWYTKDPGITQHCPFEDDCDSLIPYDGNASSYTANVGNIGISALGVPLVEDEHLQGVIFSPGVGANFAFASDFYNCDDDANCYLAGLLTIKNATSLDIQ
ncbi:hypothetical protein ASALC70_00596 [Alcanivorax sp. ALC70]|nr:hypothetical protein ASALC70_00596 [Alcanivorax sp. ALC70]